MLLNEKTKLDFYNILNDNTTNNFADAENSLCKISDNQLEDNYIELSCGHKFNYLPLYNEIKYQKTNKYAISYDYTKLDNTIIKFNPLSVTFGFSFEVLESIEFEIKNVLSLSNLSANSTNSIKLFAIQNGFVYIF